MGVPVKAICSECLTSHFTTLEFGQDEIKCPACGHSMKNLPEGELNQIETTVKKQKIMAIVSLVLFLIAGGCFFYWAFNKWDLKTEDTTRTIFLGGAIVLALASLVLGILGSLKRFVVEY